MTANAYLSSSYFTERVQAPHEVTDDAKLAAIISDLETEGWTGRPLLLVEECDEDGEPTDSYTALTGSHRIAALRDLYRDGIDFEIPCVVVPGTLLAESGYSTSDCGDEDASLAVLEAIGAEDAIATIKAEIDANNEEA